MDKVQKRNSFNIESYYWLQCLQAQFPLWRRDAQPLPNKIMFDMWISLIILGLNNIVEHGP
jgi:hypothetical protein